MARSPMKKEDILKTIIAAWKESEREVSALWEKGSPDEMYFRGRYTAMLDLLQKIHIYE